jgi:hypothetical protein
MKGRFSFTDEVRQSVGYSADCRTGDMPVAARAVARLVRCAGTESTPVIQLQTCPNKRRFDGHVSALCSISSKIAPLQ